MWASFGPCSPIISTPTSSSVNHLQVSLLGTSHRRRLPATSSSAGGDIGGFGQAFLSALKSNITETKTPSEISTQNQNQEKQNQNQIEKLGIGDEEREISGSDVLWALQNAAVKKKKKKKVKKMKNDEKNSIGGDEDGDNLDEEDYSNVRPLNIKKEWSIKLDELELRLKELSSEI